MINNIDYITILDRNIAYENMRNAIQEFKNNSNDLLQKRGIYVYGAPGTGKTSFVKRILEEIGYDIVYFDAGDIRNKNVIENITKHNLSNKNVLSMFYDTHKPIAVVMDEIDGMNNGDKGGINSLIKLIRPKKTKKQKTEEITGVPVICISNYHVDKKIKELMKVCFTIELKTPTLQQMQLILKETMPDLNKTITNDIALYLHGDLRKLSSLQDVYLKNPLLLINGTINSVFKSKSYNEDTKDITKNLINERCSILEHATKLNETDRTIVGLLWHENIVDVLSKIPNNKALPFYHKALNNICYSDYIDRVTFQKQIWQFNEMSSLIKTFNNNKIYHDDIINTPKYNPSEVRFTKVLTKYSTEYNNTTFIQILCQQLGMDKKDMFAFFLELKNKHTDDEIFKLFESYEISKLDINRIYRYLDKYTGATLNDELE